VRHTVASGDPDGLFRRKLLVVRTCDASIRTRAVSSSVGLDRKAEFELLVGPRTALVDDTPRRGGPPRCHMRADVGNGGRLYRSSVSMSIRFQPKSRASIDQAPGPSSASAAQIAATSQ